MLLTLNLVLINGVVFLNILGFKQPSITFPIVFPRCLTLLTHGKGFPHRERLGSVLGFLRKAISHKLSLTLGRVGVSRES